MKTVARRLALNEASRRLAYLLAGVIALFSTIIAARSWESWAYRDLYVIVSTGPEGRSSYYASTVKRWQWLPVPHGKRVEISEGRFRRAQEAGIQIIETVHRRRLRDSAGK